MPNRQGGNFKTPTIDSDRSRRRTMIARRQHRLPVLLYPRPKSADNWAASLTAPAALLKRKRADKRGNAPSSATRNRANHSRAPRKHTLLNSGLPTKNRRNQTNVRFRRSVSTTPRSAAMPLNGKTAARTNTTTSSRPSTRPEQPPAERSAPGTANN